MRNEPSPPVLVISGQSHLARLWQDYLEKWGLDVVCVDQWEPALRQVREMEWTGVVLETTELGGGAAKLFRQLRAASPEPTVSILVVVEREEEAEALRPFLGAHDQCWTLWESMLKVRRKGGDPDWPPAVAEQRKQERNRLFAPRDEAPPNGVLSLLDHRRRRKPPPDEDDFPPEAA